MNDARPVTRDPRNPILRREDIPDVPPHFTDPTSVFNPGAVRIGDRVHLLLRVQARSRETFLLNATSTDGRRFDITPEIVRIEGLDPTRDEIHHIYDPRITPIDDGYVIVLAVDTDDGCRLATVRTDDFQRFELLDVGTGDARNGVIFPERIGGRYLRLERPNQPRDAGNPGTGDIIILTVSDDLTSWQPIAPVMRGRPHLWDERIGSGPPPVKTREGWLHVYHGVATHFDSVNIYQAGVVLLDLEDPTIVIARGRHNILEPREPYELMGQVPNVVFPAGWVVEDVDTDGFAAPTSTVLLYYGAADTCIGLATTTIDRLLAACRD